MGGEKKERCTEKVFGERNGGKKKGRGIIKFSEEGEGSVEKERAYGVVRKGLGRRGTNGNKEGRGEVRAGYSEGNMSPHLCQTPILKKR